MSPSRSFVFACALVALTTSWASGQIILDISTGLNAAHTTLVPNLTVDPNYTITGPGGVTLIAQARTQSSLPPQYLNDAAMPGSRWLYGVTNTSQSGAVFHATGNYFFRTNVDLTGVSPADAYLKDIRVSSDNAFLQIRVNSTVVFSRPLPPANPWIEEFDELLTLPTQLGQGAFAPGINTVEFQVFNGSVPVGDSSSPLAFRMLGAVAVPEPSSMIFAVCGVVTLAARARRKANSEVPCV